MARLNFIKRSFDFIASVKLAIPLLVLIAAASVVGTLIPQGRNVKLASDAPQWVQALNSYLQLNNIFYSWWYLALLGLLGLSLVAVTVRRVPAVWKARGRGPALGILLAHTGIILMLAGMIYGGLSGFRYYTRLIEGEATVIPQLPFVIKLERLDLQYYSAEALSHRGPDFQMAEKQESVITLLRHGSPFLNGTAAPGQPLSTGGITLLPAQKEVGWAFDLVLEAGGREKVVPIRPWAPALITLGLGNPNQVMTHRLIREGPGNLGFAQVPVDAAAEVFLLQQDGTSRSLGFAKQKEPLKFGAWSFSVANVRRYTGVHIYSRPAIPILLVGVLTLLVGLVGYFTRWGYRLLPHLRGDVWKRRRRSGQRIAPAGSVIPEKVMSHVVHPARD
jgi:cytochrome c biogenesis protein ResB